MTILYLRWGAVSAALIASSSVGAFTFDAMDGELRGKLDTNVSAGVSVSTQGS